MYSINRVFLLSGFFAYRMFLLLLRIIFDFAIFPTQIHRFFLHHFFAYRVFASFLPFFDNSLLFPEKISNFFVFLLFSRIFIHYWQFILFYFSLHLMDHAPAAALPKQKRLSIEEKLWHDLLF